MVKLSKGATDKAETSRKASRADRGDSVPDDGSQSHQ